MIQDGQRTMFRIRRQLMRQILDSNRKAQQLKNQLKKKQQKQYARFSSNINQDRMQQYYVSNQIERGLQYSQKQQLKQDYQNKIKQKQIRKYQQKLKQTKYAMLQNQRQQYFTEKRIADMIKVIDRKRYHAQRFNHPHYRSFTSDNYKDVTNNEPYQEPQNIQTNNNQRDESQDLYSRKKSLNNGRKLEYISTPNNIRKSLNIRSQMQDSYKYHSILPEQSNKNVKYSTIDYKQKKPVAKKYSDNIRTQPNPQYQDYENSYNQYSPIKNQKILRNTSTNKRYAQNLQNSYQKKVKEQNLDKLQNDLLNKRQIKLDFQTKVIEIKQSPSKIQQSQGFYYMNVKPGHYRQRRPDYKY